MKVLDPCLCTDARQSKKNINDEANDPAAST